VHLEIPSRATALISKDDIIFTDSENNDQRPVSWMEYYYYRLQMFPNNLTTAEGFVRLPLDPTDPLIEIVTFKPKWVYAYADRSFYNRSVDNNSNYYQGGSAFEVYGSSGVTHDRLRSRITDTTSLTAGISKVLSKEWNYVDCLIIVTGAESTDELVIYHVWDLRKSPDGRVIFRNKYKLNGAGAHMLDKLQR
jgi:hypothetical protein